MFDPCLVFDTVCVRINTANTEEYISPEGRSDVARRLVTIGVPFLATDQESGSVMKRNIVNAIRLEIQSGTFRRD